MKNFMIVRVLCIVISLTFTSGQTLDAINLLASCGSQCWTQDPNNRSPEDIHPEPQVFDASVVRCMQVCFATKTKKVDNEHNLPPQQIIKIKVSAFCGYICYNNNKMSKKSLDYCYAGCLGTILQSKNKPQQQQKHGLQQHNHQNQQPLPSQPQNQPQVQPQPQVQSQPQLPRVSQPQQQNPLLPQPQG